MTEIVSFNGAFLPADAVPLSLSDRGLTLGDGVFDTLLAHDGAPVDAQAHESRFLRHAAVLGIPCPPVAFDVAIPALLFANGFTAGRHAVRTTLTRGPSARGLACPEKPEPTLIVRAAPAPEAAAALSAIVSRTVRRNEGSPLSRIKSLNYGDNILALREAKERGADEAIMLNNRGMACCGTASSLFVLLDGQWLTPPPEDGVLDGIMRARLLKTGLVRESSVTQTMLMDAEAAGLSNSLLGLRPLSSLDKKTMDAQAVQKLAAVLADPQ